MGVVPDKEGNWGSWEVPRWTTKLTGLGRLSSYTKGNSSVAARCTKGSTSFQQLTASYRGEIKYIVWYFCFCFVLCLFFSCLFIYFFFLGGGLGVCLIVCLLFCILPFHQDHSGLWWNRETNKRWDKMQVKSNSKTIIVGTGGISDASWKYIQEKHHEISQFLWIHVQTKTVPVVSARLIFHPAIREHHQLLKNT